MSKKRIIAIVTIIVLLFAAGISVGVFLYGRGETQAAEGNQTTEQNQPDGGTSVLPDSNGTQTGEGNEQVTNPDAGDETQTPDEDAGNIADGDDNEDEEGNVGNAGNAGVTTNPNVGQVGETTITRVEEQERLISEAFWDWWKPMSVAITPSNIGVEVPQITVKKAAITGVGGDQFAYAGQDITYVIAVTNNSEKDVENIEVTDKIPQNTTFVSIKDAYILKNVDGELSSEVVGTKTTIGTESTVGVKWVISIPAGETVIARFTVNVNEDVKGTISNTAIANGEESNDGEPTKTAIIESSKSSVITRNGQEVEIAKIGDLITYKITVENTGEVEGTTYITDTVPKGTKFVSAQEGATVSEAQDTVLWSVVVPAGEVVTREFVVEVISVNGVIKNIAKIEDVPTNEDVTETANINVEKVVTDIKRNETSIGTEAKVQEGDVIEYKITVTNTGSKDLTNVVVDEKLVGISINAEDLKIGELLAGESVEIVATYTVTYETNIKKDEDKTILNEVYVSGETDSEKVEDEDETKTTVEDAPSIKIEKTATDVNGKEITSTTKVRPDDIIEYTITVENTGNVELTNVTITDTLEVTYNEEVKNPGDIITTIETLKPSDKPVEIKVYYKVTEIDCATLEQILNVATATAGDGTTDTDEDDTVVVNVDTSVTITKIWDDANDQDGKRPETITINLYADGTFVDTETISGTTHTFEKLPKYNENGNEIVYTVAENAVSEYITSYSENTLTITNTHTPEMISAILVTKSWNDNNNQDGIRPEKISVSLLEDGTVIRTLEITEENNWVASFENLPVYKAGKVINYTITENNVPEGYTAQITGSVENGFTATNTHVPETTQLTAIKSWDDNNDQDGIRPTSVEITLYADGVEKLTQTATSENNWTTTFTNIPKYKDGGIEIVYTVDEKVEPNGYTKSVNGNTITNIHTPETTELTATKVWDDANDQDGIRPNSVQIVLYADGVEKQTQIATSASDWKVTFTNLPKYKDGGKLIVYTIDEKVVAERYTKSVNENTITNKHIPETTEVTATKVWDDSNNQDGIRPTSVEITLYADGVEKLTQTATSASDWKTTFTNLPKYKDGGKLIVYTIDEKVETYGYTKSVNGNTITNIHTPETTELTATKVWDDANNQDGIRPTSVQITLYADGVEKQVQTITLANNWEAVFSNLPKYKDGGKVIVYTVDEKVVSEGYTKSVNGNTITNKHIPATTEVTVTKVWVDENNQDGIRPNSVNVSLLANGTVKETVDITAANNWKYTFENLPEKANGQVINYTVVENTVVSGYSSTVDGYTITNTHDTDKTSITATKVWDDANDQDGIRPTSVELTLYADSVEKQTVTVNAESNWRYTFTDLPVNSNGTPIVYTVDEKTVPTKYIKTVNGYTVTNSYTPETTEVTATKVWDDANDQDGIRPISVEIILYADGVEKDTQVITLADDWKAIFSNLPKYKNGGQLIEYTVDENVVANGYTKLVNGNTITNSHIPAITEVTATKVWDDANNQDGIRPTSVEIILYADGVEKDAKVITASESWKATFSNLPKHKNSGQLIEYTVDEKVVAEGYTKNVNGYAITNKHIPATTEVTVTKVWEDANNQDGIRPNSVNVSLLSNGTVKETVDITATNNWKYTFENLPEKANGQIINYTVVENNVPSGYKAEVSGDMTSGYTVTNTHQVEKTSVKVNKVWNDNNNQDGLRQDSISVSLMNGTTVVDTQELSDSNKWEYTFINLDKKANGKVINYTVVENNVPAGYKAEVSGDMTSGYTVTNTHQVEKTSVKVNKVWNDNNNQDGIRTPVISISLMNGTTTVATQSLSAANNWEYIFTNLDKKSNGVDINYTVVENSVPSGYTAEVTGDKTSGYTVTNTHQVEKTSVTVNKVWNDNDNQDGLRQDSISVSLMNGTTVLGTQILSGANNWTYTFENLDKKANGSLIPYTVVENSVPSGYRPQITGSAVDGYTITNTHIPETINIPVVKVWADHNNAYSARTEITVNLKANGKQVDTIKLSSSNEWQNTFTNVPKYDNGVEITYEVEEANIPERYTSQVIGSTAEGYTITNTYNNVIINKKTLASTSTETTSSPTNVDVMFVLDISGSMVKYKVSDGNGGEITRAQAMVNATNKAITAIMAKNASSRIGITMFSGDATTVLQLNSYTPKTTVNNIGQYLLYTETTETYGGFGGYYTETTYEITTNVNQATAVTKEVTGGTYTQYGIAKGANELVTATNVANRTPVIVLLTDGEPTYATSNYNNVTSSYNIGDGSVSNNGNRGYYTVLSANHYKGAVDAHYTDADAQMYTVGIGMSGIYNETILDPNSTNVAACGRETSGAAEDLYDYLTGKTNPYTNYDYANGSWAGEMNATTLNNILTTITQNITKTYSTTTTYTTNIPEGTSRVELTNLDITKKITIKLDSQEAQEYDLATLTGNSTVILENGKYYIDLKASMFTEKDTINITYYEVETQANA